MVDTNSDNQLGLGKLILVPSLITLGITVLRLVGELQGWPSALFNKQAGGGGAIVGISWLPIFFGIYFALKLAGAGAGPESLIRTLGLWAVGLVLFVGGAYLGFMAFQSNSSVTGIGGLVLMAAAVVVQLWGWPSLAKALVAYAYAARIPVLVVMYLAFQGKWGTHYDALPPDFVSNGFASDFLKLAVFPQLILWIAFTVLVGTLCGAIAAAATRGRRQASQAA